MFSKTSDPSSSPAASASSAPPPAKYNSNASRSIIGTDLKITGELISSGAVEVFGQVDGNLTADQLTIGSDGRVNGAIRANSVEVKGRVEGKVDCDSFTMRAAAVVSADVTYTAVTIESGATIEGRFTKVKA